MGDRLRFRENVYVNGVYSVGSKMENQGPIGTLLSAAVDNDMFGEKTFEQAERKFFITAAKGAANDAGVDEKEVDLLVGGDLLDQIISAGYGARELGIPFLGIYGACSSMAEGLLISAMAVNGCHGRNAVCATASSFGAAERQFRFPLELGTPRTPTSQHTVTGAAACFLTREKKGAYAQVAGGMIGKVVDMGVTDANNMGAAMAGAALQTIADYLEAADERPDDFDAIITGDLGTFGSELLIDMGKRCGIGLSGVHKDCGCIIYEGLDNVQCGGSGCACGGTVLCAKYIPMLMKGKIRRIMFVATGALLSPVIINQGESIPSIAHAVILEGVE